MLKKYVKLQPGDWIIQDAANSGVGQCIIRLAKMEGIKTINIVNINVNIKKKLIK